MIKKLFVLFSFILWISIFGYLTYFCWTHNCLHTSDFDFWMLYTKECIIGTISIFLSSALLVFSIYKK